jgi:Flp pilus assembly protein TadB
MSQTPFIFAWLALLYAILMLLLFFFVWRIRRDVQSANQQLRRIEDLLLQLQGKSSQAPASSNQNDDRGRLIRLCENCGRKNSLQDVQCMGCGEVLQ